MNQLNLAFDSAKSILAFLLGYWWIYLPFLLLAGVIEMYKVYTRTKYVLSLKWVLLEVKPPPDVAKSPKIAENIFSALHGMYKGGTGWKEMFFQGKIPDWFSFEIIGGAGEMHFYIRTLESFRNLVEVAIFSQYPDAEVALADDYVNALPPFLPNKDYDLFGSELIFTKPNAFPIKTYPEFEEEGQKDSEFKRTDPLAPLAEIFGILVPGEYLWLQLLARPTGDDWTKEAQETIDKMLGKEAPKPAPGALASTFDFLSSVMATPSAPGEKKPEKKEKAEPSPARLTPGQKFVLEQIEHKVAKLAFKAGYRFMYVAKKEVFNRSRIPAVIGMFKQMYSNNLNTFKPNSEVTTSGKGWFSWMFPMDKGFFASSEEYKKKYRLYRKYRRRDFVKKHVILNTEELATLFHLPGLSLRSPVMPRVESKKAQPPMGLPTKDETAVPVQPVRQQEKPDQGASGLKQIPPMGLPTRNDYPFSWSGPVVDVPSEPRGEEQDNSQNSNV